MAVLMCVFTLAACGQSSNAKNSDKSAGSGKDANQKVTVISDTESEIVSETAITAETSDGSLPAATGEDEETASEEATGEEETMKPKTKDEVDFSELKTFSKSGSDKLTDVTTDPWDNVYNNVLVLKGSYYHTNTGSTGYDQPYIEKYLGGEYKTFYGTIVPQNEFDKYNKEIKAAFKIYADDKLVYTSDPITKKTKGIDFKVSTENVDYLKIELVAQTQLTSYENIYNIILTEAKVSKKVIE